MPKYMILHNAPEPASELIARTKPEDQQAAMEAWIAWKEEADKKVKFEFGMPLQAVGRVTPEGVTESDSQASGYSMIEADSSETVIDVLRNHPHLARPGATMDILEIIPMPGM
ncbi:MAG: hypothetical protein JWN26_208 [Candidatus Saccharibacteria bacterium]|nr:hypothetical protein [Candidatus Saccharibacteria bacterium]